MRRWMYSISAVAVILAPVAGVAQASALTVWASQPIYIKTQVLPTHTVIIDPQGTIQEIISNTPKDNAQIKVYVGAANSPANARPLTPEIYHTYQQLIKTSHSHVGALYKRPSPLAFITSSRFN